MLSQYEITRTGGAVKIFSVGFNPTETNDILDIHKYLMKKTSYKTMFVLNKKIFIGLLIGLFNGSNHTKCIWLINQKCMTQPTLSNLSQEFHDNKFSVKLVTCVGSCNTLNDLSNKVCIPNETEDSAVQHDCNNKLI